MMWHLCVIASYFVSSYFAYMYLLGVIVATEYATLRQYQKYLLYQYVELTAPFILLLALLGIVLFLLKINKKNSIAILFLYSLFFYVIVGI
jgi:hypothetical protein